MTNTATPNRVVDASSEPNDIPSASELASAAINQLASAGSDVMFGVPGGGNNLEIVGAAEAAGIRFVLVHGETAAAIMAAVYADLTGRPTVCAVTRGPGAASVVNGAAHALLDRQPLLVLTDCVAQKDRGRISHQQLSQRALFSGATKWSGTLGAGDAAATMQHAISVTQSPPWGPVHLDFDPTAASSVESPVVSPAEPTREQLDEVLARLKQSGHPVVVLGVAARNAAEEIRSLLRDTNIPVLMTYRAKGIVPDSWDNNAGLFTGATTEGAVLHAADLILAIGLDSVELIPSKWEYTAPVVSLAAWPEDHPYFEPELEVIGELPFLVNALDGHLVDDWDTGFGNAKRAEGLTRLKSGPSAAKGLAPPDVVRRVRAAAPSDAIATVDSGAHMLVTMPLWETDLIDGILISSGLATMGFALPAAIAASLANPDRRIVCFVGDGGLHMALAELETVARLQLSITIVVFNDSRLSLIAVKAKPEGHGGSNAITYIDTDFVRVAEGLGLPAAASSTVDELDAQAQQSFSRRGPMLLDVGVDPSLYPHVFDAIRGPRTKDAE